MFKKLIAFAVFSFCANANAECLHRFYSKDHLKKFPKQELRTVLINVAQSYNEVDTKAKIDLRLGFVRQGKLKFIDTAVTCPKVPYGFFYDPFVDINEVANTQINCSHSQGSITITRLKNPDFDYTFKLSTGFPFVDADTGASDKLTSGDSEFRVSMDKNIGSLSCEPVLFQPQKVSTSRLWSEALLQSVRYDLARPTVTSRNLFHFSAIMWDVYASFDKNLTGYSFKTKVNVPKNIDLQEARSKALSFAAYTFLKERFKNAPGNAKDNRPDLFDLGSGDDKPDELINSMLNKIMFQLGIDPTAKESSAGFDAAGFGTKVAKDFLAAHIEDGSRESTNYAPEKNYILINNYGYMDVMQSGVRTPVKREEIKDANGEVIEEILSAGEEFADHYDINHWLPKYIPGSLDQNGNEVDSAQAPLTLFWGKLPTFSDLSKYKSPSKEGVYFDEIAKIPTFEENTDEFIKANLAVLEASQALNPMDLVANQKDFDGDGQYDINPGAEKIDISPNTMGNNPLGTNIGKGYPLNPVSGKPYARQMVRRADYYRCLAEFWADGPRSETPPGHWNVLANSVIDSMSKNKIPFRWKGQGSALAREQYELMTYFTLNGALYDAGIVAWGLKGHYQGSRPLTAIRKLAKMAENDLEFGKKLEQLSPSVKMVTFDFAEYPFANFGMDESQAPVTKKVTKLAVKAWRGPGYFGEIPNFRNTSFIQRNDLSVEENTFYAENGAAGVGWIMAENWLPYQQQTFVTPPFPGFISGHSTFSRAAAEVLTGITGSEFFPGGLGTYKAPQLVFESDEIAPFEFQWARYYDAADESGISRIYGGIHATFDDTPGRKIGSQIGKEALKKADAVLSTP